MYPFLDPRIGGTGIEQGTIELIDDVAAVSDVYPAAGWPADLGRAYRIDYRTDSVAPMIAPSTAHEVPLDGPARIVRVMFKKPGADGSWRSGRTASMKRRVTAETPVIMVR